MITLHDLKLILAGAIFMADVAVALLFAGLWRRTHDRLFAWFCAAFAVLAIERLLLLRFTGETVNPVIFAVRLLAFLLIIAAIIDRNRRTKT
ncbi:MAG TPA: DUF5985 family protein [Opitutaceae bacterium]|nr:DUF5985 family protein [Opitutaceae bacterium]